VALRGRTRLWLASAATLALVLPLGWFWQASLLPDSYDLATMGEVDWGGGPRAQHSHHDAIPVADLTTDPDRPADVTETLTVRQEGEVYTVNGTSPGPVLEADQGDVVEVTMVNENVEDGATFHWHGVDVPNASDGVAGVTQDAVMPGEEFTYRFVADQAGTFWYHSHQVSHEQVRRGLLGAFVIHPPDPDPGVTEGLAVIHEYDGRGATVNGKEGLDTLDVAPGDQVRVRVVNTDNGLTRVWVSGAPYRVLAVDGTEINQPGEVSDATVDLPAGGRVDLGIEVPEGGARVELGGATSLVLGEDPTGGGQASPPEDVVDLLSYGEPADLGFDPEAADRHFTYRIGKRPGFLDGRPGIWWTVNGKMYPDVPMYMVSEGDVVVFDIDNESDDAHPMHLHGHHAVVLSRDGEPATGSPWWVDSLEVRPGESFRVAFVADNPGVWMDHCHNLPHAAEGLVAHLMYDGVSSSYRVGGDHGNEPE
jgi:FtsP/CotA-like multicopper oxidase with cupredoxin domain